MANKEQILDPSEYDLNNIVSDINVIRQYNLQRHEMEQLTAVVYEDVENRICVGYKDLTDDEFWVRGHMPGMPLMPGVLMCESAAQIASYFVQRHGLMDTSMVGFGALDEVRFRGVVRPGDRFVVVAKMVKARRLLVTCRFECFVEDDMVCDGILKGIRLPKDLLPEGVDS